MFETPITVVGNIVNNPYRQRVGDHVPGDQLPVAGVDPVDQTGLPAYGPLGIGGAVRADGRSGDQHAAGRRVPGGDVGHHRRVHQRTPPGPVAGRPR